MQHKNIEVIDGDVFISYSDLAYLQKLMHKRNKIHKTNLFSDSLFSPKFYKHTPFKIHITLRPDHYLQHKEAIKKILIDAINNHVITDFKMVNDSKLREKLDSLQLLVTQNVFTKEQLHLLKKYYGNYPSGCFGIPADIQLFYESGRRFLEGDQFTIYISEITTPEKILALCQTLVSYLQHEFALPGRKCDVARSLDAHGYLDFRQEYLNKDFATFQACLPCERNLRIEATPPVFISEAAKENEVVRRELVRGEINENPLFQYLRANLNPSIETSLKPTP